MESALVTGVPKGRKHGQMKSRFILLFDFPFRKSEGRIMIRSIWFHICSRNYPRHRSIFLLSILKHPRSSSSCPLLHPPSLFHGHRAADRLPERSSCHCYRRRESLRPRSQDFCGSVVSLLCSALHEGSRIKSKCIPAG